MRASSTDIAVTSTLEIAYRMNGSGPPLIMFHGGEGDHRVYELVQDALAQSFTTISFDQRDCGVTKYLGLPPEHYTLDDVAHDAVELLQTLGYERAHVFGVSLGGLMAQLMAIHWPGAVDKLVLGLTWPADRRLIELNPAALRRRQELVALGPEGDVGLAELFSSPEYVTAHPDVVDSIRDLRTMPSEAGKRRRIRAATTVELVDPAVISRPTLVLAGERDQMVPPCIVEMLVKVLPAARFEVIPGVGHLAAREKPDLVAALVKDFLDA